MQFNIQYSAVYIHLVHCLHHWRWDGMTSFKWSTYLSILGKNSNSCIIKCMSFKRSNRNNPDWKLVEIICINFPLRNKCDEKLKSVKFLLLFNRHLNVSVRRSNKSRFLLSISCITQTGLLVPAAHDLASRPVHFVWCQLLILQDRLHTIFIKVGPHVHEDQLISRVPEETRAWSCCFAMGPCPFETTRRRDVVVARRCPRS